MHVLHEERADAVLEAARREHAAWTDLERAIRPDAADEAAIRAYRERWRLASRRLIEALEALKNVRR
ncbi:MAG: hypothetical protein E6G36_02400 [Actinobacteria bacterium]|nr:MAG: hypothetical protein E6G36_02400 [Actinomycetota bacterium]